MLNVETGAECRARSGENDHAAIGYLGFVESLGNLFNQEGTQGIAFIRTVEGNGHYPVGGLGKNMTKVSHDDLLDRQSNRRSMPANSMPVSQIRNGLS
jgi:hypothetical protein